MLLFRAVGVFLRIIEGEVELSCILVGIGPSDLFLFGFTRLLGKFPRVRRSFIES